MKTITKNIIIIFVVIVFDVSAICYRCHHHCWRCQCRDYSRGFAKVILIVTDVNLVAIDVIIIVIVNRYLYHCCHHRH